MIIMSDDNFGVNSNKVHLKIHAPDDMVDWNTREQIYGMAKHPSVKGLIAMMPDCHAGKGCVVGTTLRFADSVCANFIGVDIGCGVFGVKIDDIDIDFPAFDEAVRKAIPLDMNHRDERDGQHLAERIGKLNVLKECEEVARNIGIPANRGIASQLGTLGGGNHFIEVGQGDGCKWIFIHSGSRNFGLKVATYHQNRAVELCKEMNIRVPKGQEYLPMSRGGFEYLDDMKVAQEFASMNRAIMMDKILGILGVRAIETIESVHNWISPEDDVCRKGAISAHEGERVLIPLNMRDGTIIGTGKGNKDYNNSAPHGAGRTGGSRSEMKRKLKDGRLTMEQFEEAMKGIFSTCVVPEAIDESPMAYKPFEAIKDYLEATVDIDEIVIPIYNLKGTGKKNR